MNNIIKLESGKDLNLVSISAREIRITHHTLSSVKEKKDEKGNIIGITIDNFNIELNTILQLKLFDKRIRPFKVLTILPNNKNNSYTIFSSVLTKASRWIMPMLRLTNETQTSMKYSTHFVNCYVGTAEEGYMENIYLVYRFSGETSYIEFEEKLKNHDLFEGMIDLDNHHVMYIFNMTSENKINFNKFIKGQYSKFSDDYKKQILSFNINPSVISESDINKTIAYGVLYKTALRRKTIQEELGHDIILPKDNELFSIPEESEEIYNSNIEIPKQSSMEQAMLDDFENKEE